MKKYTLNSGVLINLNKIVTQIKREIIGKNIKYDYIVNIDLSKDYLNISKEDFNVENLNDFLNNLNDLDLLELNEIESRKKLLKSFREELGSKLNQNESVLEDIFNKYQSLLALILKGVDATLDFQYYISSEGRNMIADANMTESSGNVNIIELKNPNDKFFTPSNSEYRTNTIRLNPSFSNAIHQANMQRVYNAVNRKDIYNVQAKSILIYGNKQEEFNNQNRDILHKNLENIKYNNKDLLIISYDEIIERIDLLINKS